MSLKNTVIASVLLLTVLSIILFIQHEVIPIWFPNFFWEYLFLPFFITIVSDIDELL